MLGDGRMMFPLAVAGRVQIKSVENSMWIIRKHSTEQA